MDTAVTIKLAHEDGQRLSGRIASEVMNNKCFCTSLDTDALRAALSDEVGDVTLFQLVQERCPFLFSSRPIFVSHSQTKLMAAVIGAIESVIAMQAYRELVLDDAPDIARHDPGGAKGVFYGYDFHPGGDGLGLIEINTNAGGAMLNAMMARAHRSCCLDDAQRADANASGAVLEEHIVEMFLSEWRASNRGKRLETIAIVDLEPEQQYLYPEFILFQRLFQRHGIRTVISDPSDLKFEMGILTHATLPIDLVYNRLTDFMLESPVCQSLKAAYLERAVVLTPHPQAHALYANKKNLAVLTDPLQLQSMGVSQEVQDLLMANIPHTEVVDAEQAERLWKKRRGLFFKPLAGYGGRAAYRGEKMTRRVWTDVLNSDYIAQALVAPGERITGTSADPVQLKFDLRCYVYDGQVQWTAARMYQGQTTNFRTPGGGFAPVYSLADAQVTEGIEAINQGIQPSNGCCASICST